MVGYTEEIWADVSSMGAMDFHTMPEELFLNWAINVSRLDEDNCEMLADAMIDFRILGHPMQSNSLIGSFNAADKLTPEGLPLS
jgi:hypothetical protein